jgi:hypothetical protein
MPRDKFAAMASKFFLPIKLLWLLWLMQVDVVGLSARDA